MVGSRLSNVAAGKDAGKKRKTKKGEGGELKYMQGESCNVQKKKKKKSEKYLELH